MEKCPFCGKQVSFGFPHVMQLEDGKWAFEHVCQDNPEHAPFIFISANTQEELYEIWNTRN